MHSVENRCLPLKIAVVYEGSGAKKAAEKIAEGAREAGASVQILKAGAGVKQFDLVFAGWSSASSYPASVLKTVKEAKQAAVFWVRGGFGKPFDKFLADAYKDNVKIASTFTVETSGPLKAIGFGTPTDDSLIRARGFAERLVCNLKK